MGNKACCDRAQTDSNGELLGAPAPTLPGTSTSNVTAHECPPAASTNEAPVETKVADQMLNNESQGGANSESSQRPDGSSYTGQMVGGKAQGVGTCKWETTEYVGQWVDDRQHGEGEQTWLDGRRYKGQFAESQFSGSGRMEWVSEGGKLVYDGEYQKDKKHGKGVFTWPDTRKYDGEWQDGKRHGEATYTNASGVERKGVWQMDKLIKWTAE